MKNLLIILLVIGYCALVITAPVVAAGENLLLVTPHAGGSAEAISGALKLWTIYGQPFAGQSDATGGYIGKWGAIWWGDEVTVVATGEDNGLINSTVIERVADIPDSDIRIKFRAKDASVTQASIYRLSGPGTEFSNQTATWALVAQDIAITTPGQSNDTTWLESNGINIQPPPPQIKVADGNNAYYRVVPSTVTDPAQIFGSDASGTPYNARTVGKVDIVVSGPMAGSAMKYTFASVPFIQLDDSLDKVFGIQLTPSDQQGAAPELWGWSGTSFGKQAYLKSSGWKKVNTANAAPDFSHEYGAGYFIKTKTGQSDVNLTFVGIVNTGTFEYGGSVPVRGNLYSALSNPYPMKIGIGSLGLNTVLKSGAASGLADQLWAWTGNSFGAQSFLKTDGAWPVVSGAGQKVDYFESGKGYLLRRVDPTTGSVTWKFSPFQ